MKYGRKWMIGFAGALAAGLALAPQARAMEVEQAAYEGLRERVALSRDPLMKEVMAGCEKLRQVSGGRMGYTDAIRCYEELYGDELSSRTLYLSLSATAEGARGSLLRQVVQGCASEQLGSGIGRYGRTLACVRKRHEAESAAQSKYLELWSRIWSGQDAEDQRLFGDCDLLFAGEQERYSGALWCYELAKKNHAGPDASER